MPKYQNRSTKKDIAELKKSINGIYKDKAIKEMIPRKRRGKPKKATFQFQNQAEITELEIDQIIHEIAVEKTLGKFKIEKTEDLLSLKDETESDLKIIKVIDLSDSETITQFSISESQVLPDADVSSISDHPSSCSSDISTKQVRDVSDSKNSTREMEMNTADTTNDISQTTQITLVDPEEPTVKEQVIGEYRPINQSQKIQLTNLQQKYLEVKHEIQVQKLNLQKQVKTIQELGAKNSELHFINEGLKVENKKISDAKYQQQYMQEFDEERLQNLLADQRQNSDLKIQIKNLQHTLTQQKFKIDSNQQIYKESLQHQSSYLQNIGHFQQEAKMFSQQIKGLQNHIQIASDKLQKQNQSNKVGQSNSELTQILLKLQKLQQEMNQINPIQSSKVEHDIENDIRITVVYLLGKDKETVFPYQRNKQFKELLHQVCKLQSQKVENCVFSYKSAIIEDTDTPNSINMMDEGFIYFVKK